MQQVKQLQQVEQQQHQEQQQLQLQQALQAERDHWSARLQAANDEWRRKLEDEQRQAEAKLQQQQREAPAWHELHALALESRRHSEEFKRLLQSLQQQQQQQLQQQQLQLQQMQQQLQKQQGADAAGMERQCEACGRQAEMQSAVAALQQQQHSLQQQQQALVLLAQETAKLRDETEQRTRAASAKLAAESLQLQSLHRSLLESRQQQQLLQQQQQQQLQQQQQFIEQQQHAFAQRQLQAESEVATKQLELDQKERDIERREGRLAGAVAIQEKQQKARRDYLQTAESHLLKLQSALQQERRAYTAMHTHTCIHTQIDSKHIYTSIKKQTQELTETALALEEKRRALRRCFEDMEVQRLAFEGRAAAAAAEAESAAAEARNAKTLQQESLRAKEAVHQLHRQAKDAERQQQEQQEIIKSLLREVETSRLELLRMQQQSGQLHVRRLSSGRCSVTGGSRAHLSFVLNPEPIVPHRRVRAFFCSNSHSSKSLTEVADAPQSRSYNHHASKRLLPLQHLHPEGAFQEALHSLSRTSEIITQKREAAHERLWSIRNTAFNNSSTSHGDLRQIMTSVKAFHAGLTHPNSASLGRPPPLTCIPQRQQHLQPADNGISEFTDG
ncbi:LOW QUALITY PROTEIN: uncharacterized protein EMH_0053140 [Eimeria mitis]|uniref:Uncharacterized protein n=1 Tax=Eimeria mitis TaxID=44415 RepID=U6K267_9EIME|nr:LOW QUALITY PROTEIN: uncharacterized protein EMH_0053140 [Eimeria mitis]CDJ29838.1 hypothetical protein, conserved [Eimeria mitis]